jgi:hypothetical protein
MWCERTNAREEASLLLKASAPNIALSALSKFRGGTHRRCQVAAAAPDGRSRTSVGRWRVIKERFDVDLDGVSIGRVLKELGFAHVSPSLQHPRQDPQDGADL